MKLLNNIPKLIAIMYIFIFFKNVLQLIFGYLFSIETDIKFYKIYNIQDSVYTFDFVITLVLVYECLVFAFMYFLIFLILYFIIIKFGNKLWIHVIYLGALYVLIINGTKDEFNVFYFSIMAIAGILNWGLFKKWIK